MKKVTLSLLVAILTSCFFFSQKTTAQLQNKTATTTKALLTDIPQKTPPPMKLGEPMPANLFIELARVINPAVVNISTSKIPEGRSANDPMLELLQQFYGVPMQQQAPPNNFMGKPMRMGLGTGFIIREDGLILTNAHVIQGADLIEVQLTEDSDKQYKAEVIGSDTRTDVALIKIKPEGKLTVAALGSSKDVEVGEWVAAFGNPYGHGHTMTKGIISSKGRAIAEINKFPLLQTDASINPGNSGGPLVNTKGYVIGINSAIDGRAQGIGFAIPIDDVKKLLPQLEKSGSLKAGYLGIQPADLNDRAAEYLQMDDEFRGAVILAVGDGPAKKAGLRPYDIITQIDNKKIRNSQDLIDTIADIDPGKKVKIKILRDNKGQAVEHTLDVIISERPKSSQGFSKPQRRMRK